MGDANQFCRTSSFFKTKYLGKKGNTASNIATDILMEASAITVTRYGAVALSTAQTNCYVTVKANRK